MEEVRDVSFNMAQVCRFCLSQSGVMSPIFDNANPMLPSLAAKIMTLAQIQIFVNDGLPSILCHRCLYMTEKAFDFKTRCEASDAMLRKYLALMQVQIPPIKTEPELKQMSPATQPADSTVKRKRGRPRKEENLIFYSSPTHSSSETATRPDQIKMVDGVESVVTVVDPNLDIVSYSDEEQRKEATENSEKDRDFDTMRSLAIARAKAKKYMGTVMAEDEEGLLVRRHLCKGCGKTYKQCSDLRKHVLVHTGERPFHCRQCPKTFSRSTNLNKHLKVHSGQKPYSCLVCTKSFSSKGDLQRHLVIHSGLKPFTCNFCQQSFSRKDKLTRHVKLHGEGLSSWTGHSVGVDALHEGDGTWHGVADDEEDSSDVPDSEAASKVDDQDGGFNVESIIVNIDPLTMGSPDQGASFDKSPNTQAAGSQDEGSEQNLPNNVTSPDRAFKCSVCYKSFGRRRELVRHESVHTGYKPHVCPICSRPFARKDKLARHMKTHPNNVEKTWFCEPCDLSFKKEAAYLEHAFSHTIDVNSDEESDEMNSD